MKNYFAKIQKNPLMAAQIQVIAMCTESFTKIVWRVKEKKGSLDYAIFRSEDP